MFLIARARNVALMVAVDLAGIVLQKKNVLGGNALHLVFLIPVVGSVLSVVM